MEWQPIDTAPKDGTWFLGWWPENKSLGDQEAIIPTRWNDTPGVDEPRFEDISDNCFDQPTHWMPLPPAPTTGDDQ